MMLGNLGMKGKTYRKEIRYKKRGNVSKIIQKTRGSTDGANDPFVAGVLSLEHQNPEIKKQGRLFFIIIILGVTSYSTIIHITA